MWCCQPAISPAFIVRHSEFRFPASIMVPASYPLLFLDDTKVPNCRKNNGFRYLGNYSEWPKVAGAVIKDEISVL